MNIATTMTAISAGIAAAEAIATEVKAIYQFVGKMMDAAEQAYSGVTNAGGTKKAAVLAAVEALVKELGLDWSSMTAAISALVDTVKAAYNGIVEAVAQKATATP